MGLISGWGSSTCHMVQPENTRKQQQEKELAINAWDMTDERVKFFRNLLNLFPDSATRILPLYSALSAIFFPLSIEY